MEQIEQLLKSTPEMQYLLQCNNFALRNQEDYRHEIRYLDKDRIVGKEYVNVVYEFAGLLFFSESRDVLISPNPVSDKELWDEVGFSKDEKKIVEVQRLVLDIDYPFSNINDILNILVRGNLNIPMEAMSIFESAGGNIRIVILLDLRHYDAPVQIKLAKAFQYLINQVLESNNFKLDNTFINNIGHFLYVENKPVKNKGDRASRPEQIATKRWSDTIDIYKEQLLSIYDDVFAKKGVKNEKKKENKGNGSNGKPKEKKEAKVDVSDIKEDEIYSLIKYINKHKKYIEEEKSRTFSKKGSYAIFSNIFYNMYSDFGRQTLPYNPYMRETFVWNYIRENLDDCVPDRVVDLEYTRKVFSYFREGLYSMYFYDKTFSKLSKSEKRFTTLLYPMAQFLVDCFGIDYILENNLYFYMVEYLCWHSDKPKHNIVEDIAKALNSASDITYNFERLNDKLFNKHFSFKNKSSVVYLASFFTDMLKNNKSGELITFTKKEIKEKYNLKPQTFRMFMKKLKEYMYLENLEITETTREIVIGKVISPEELYAIEYPNKLYLSHKYVSTSVHFKQLENNYKEETKHKVNITFHYTLNRKWSELGITSNQRSDIIIKIRKALEEIDKSLLTDQKIYLYCIDSLNYYNLKTIEYKKVKEILEMALGLNNCSTGLPPVFHLRPPTSQCQLGRRR